MREFPVPTRLPPQEPVYHLMEEFAGAGSQERTKVVLGQTESGVALALVGGRGEPVMVILPRLMSKKILPVPLTLTRPEEVGT